MSPSSNRDVEIKGTVAPGYESVKDLFEDNFRKGRENDAQLCVYVGDQMVVDLWASPNSTYTADTISNVFSSTKSLTAIAIAYLYDQGLLKYDAKISEYWPEFGQKGKEDITVADLMRHEAGLASFDTSIDANDTHTAAIKENKLGQIIESQEPSWDVNGKRSYHAITRGWIANEIFRRLHPKGLTIGEFIREKVSLPLDTRVFVGVTKDEIEDYAPVSEIKASFLFGQSLRPNALGRGIDYNFFQLVKIFNSFKKIAKSFNSKKPAFVDMNPKDPMGPLFNKETVRMGETSSANGNCSARGLAKIAAAMAHGGSFNGVKILDKASWDEMHDKPTEGGLGFGDPKMFYFTQGGVAQFNKDEGGRDGFYGWFGYGGSVFQWHPKHKIGFGFVPTLLEFHCIYNNKGRTLQGEVVRCAEKISKNEGK